MTYTLGESRDLEAGLEKTRVFKKNQPSGFFGVFGVFLGFLGVFYICAQKREFLGFFQFQVYFRCILILINLFLLIYASALN